MFNDEGGFDWDEDEHLEGRQEDCDHDWEDWTEGKEKCTYPDCGLVRPKE